LFEALVVDWLQATENIAAVAKGLRLSWDEVSGIRGRAVARGMKRRGRAPLPASVGVDETSVRRGHEYITVVNALGQGRVLDVIDDRTQASLDAFWSQYNADELRVVESVAMDMWAAYIASTRKHLPMADEKIVFDKFHIMKHLGDAVDKVRRQEHRALHAAGDDRLVKTRYLWLTHPERLEGEARERIEKLRRGALKTARAFRYKEHASRLWGYVRRGMAERLWKQWLRGALRCHLEPIRRVARMIRDHWYGVINRRHLGRNQRDVRVGQCSDPTNQEACLRLSKPLTLSRGHPVSPGRSRSLSELSAGRPLESLKRQKQQAPARVVSRAKVPQYRAPFPHRIAVSASRSTRRVLPAIIGEESDHGVVGAAHQP
jgi:transposase